ncbi:unnamed protein product [Auanema sp. JU1783]|nr:unnamed protein product [Auanema sp. JU1783]
MPTTITPDVQARYRCFCGLCHVVTGTQLCLIWYGMFSIFSMMFGMKSTLTWVIVPIIVTSLAIYGLITRKHKYLYPFLIITVVQQFVGILMAVIISTFSFFSFDTMRQIIGHSLDIEGPPSKETAIFVICGTVIACFLLTIIHFWHSLIIYRCLDYYEHEYHRLEDCMSKSVPTHCQLTDNLEHGIQQQKYSA